jgi:hypothetical protein
LSFDGIGIGIGAAAGDASAGCGGGFPAAGGGAPNAGVGGRGTALFIISMVPLNFGAAAPLRLKLHFEQVAADSGFWVPQFGQNTR